VINKFLKNPSSPVTIRGKIIKLGVILTLLMPVLLIRVIRPIILIRFGRIQTDRIGQFINDTEYYLCQRDAHHRTFKSIDLFYYDHEPVSNIQVDAMARRVINVSSINRLFELTNRKLPGGTKHTINIIRRDHNNFGKIYNLLENTPVHISFTEEEKFIGDSYIAKICGDVNQEFICFHSRDSSYLNQAHPGINWDYHDYRDSDIDTYVLAAEQLATIGYVMLRMGKTVNKTIQHSNPSIIDYASTFQTDFLDVYLSANCRFFISSGTGLDCIPNCFRRPTACVNYIPIGYSRTWGPRDIVIPKKLYDLEKAKFISFPESFRLGAAIYTRTDEYVNANIKVIDNTSEEIADLAMEMELRLSGSWEDSQEDIYRQRMFWSMFDIPDDEVQFLPKIGSSFISQNEYLFEY